MSPDEISNVLSQYHTEPQEPQEPTEPVEPKPTESKEPSEPVEPETKSPDYNQVIEYKENGQVVKKSLAEILADAQKGANYERRMQELSQKEKAFNAVLEQQQQKPETPADKLAKRQQQIEEYKPVFQREFGIEFNEFDPAHTLEMVDYYSEKKLQERELKQSKEAEQRLYTEAETEYVQYSQEASKDKNINDILKSAINALYSLPTKGSEGIAEFEKLYPIYKKIEQRDAYVDMAQKGLKPDFNKPNITKQDVSVIRAFFDAQKKEYYAKQFTPKPAEKKVPTQTEKAGSGEKPEPRKLTKEDFAKMDKDQINAVLGGYLSKQIKK
jgi:hypothetical protein